MLARIIETSGGPCAADLVEARAWAALACTYGADHATAGLLLRSVDPRDLPAGAPRVFLMIARLAHRIGGPDDPAKWVGVDDDATALLEQVERLDEANRRKLYGMALGTVGRCWMHRRAVGWAGEALPLLRGGVDHHAAFPEVRIETPRSRTYLAMALRMSGDPQAALDQIERARAEIATLLAGRAYGASTSIFVQYECARALLDLGRVPEAEAAARDAIRRMEDFGWAICGPLRTLAWACRKLGKVEETEALVRRLEAVVGGRGGAVGRILAEARGEHRADGEVF